MRVGLIVDHPKRDLTGAVRLAQALVSKCAEVCIIPMYDQGLDVPLLNLDVLVLNYARPVNLDLVRGYANQGISVFILDTEGGILSEEGANSVAGLTDYISKSQYHQLLSGYFFWGSLLYDAFVKADILSFERLHLTGCPRFDLASPRWRNTLRYPLDGYILVNANFPLVNPVFAKNAIEESKVLVRGGWSKEYVEMMVDDQKRILSEFLDTIYMLAINFPERHFLLRPHPFENEQIYRDKFAVLNNITVDGAGNVLDVIRNCACLLHLNCGTSIESVMLERLPISMEFLNTEHMERHSTLPSKISMKAHTFNHLVTIIEDLDNFYSYFNFDDVYQTHIQVFFHKNDGAAGDRVANKLLEVAERKLRPSVVGSIAWSLSSSRIGSSFWQRIQAILANLLGTLATAKLRSTFQVARREKAIDCKVVRLLAQSLAEHEKITKPDVNYALHPVTRLPLSSIYIRPSNLNNRLN